MAKGPRCLNLRRLRFPVFFTSASLTSAEWHRDPFCCWFQPTFPLSSREDHGSLHGLGNRAFEKNEPDEAWLWLFSVRNISKLRYKRPPHGTKKKLVMCKVQWKSPGCKQKYLAAKTEGPCGRQSMKGIRHKTKVRTQWYIFQAHERMCGSNTKETWISYRMGAEGEPKPNQPIQLWQRNRFGPIKGERQKLIFYELISSRVSEVVQKQASVWIIHTVHRPRNTELSPVEILEMKAFGEI